MQPDRLKSDRLLALLRDLHQTLGEQKIDIVIRRADAKHELPIHRIAYTTGIQHA